jgi:hypothetical protein
MGNSREEFKSLKTDLQRYGWDVDTYSPGDGITRYRLLRAGYSYFEAEGPTALGLAQAVAMMRGALHVLTNKALPVPVEVRQPTMSGNP